MRPDACLVSSQVQPLTQHGMAPGTALCGALSRQGILLFGTSIRARTLSCSRERSYHADSRQPDVGWSLVHLHLC